MHEGIRAGVIKVALVRQHLAGWLGCPQAETVHRGPADLDGWTLSLSSPASPRPLGKGRGQEKSRDAKLKL